MLVPWRVLDSISMDLGAFRLLDLQRCFCHQPREVESHYHISGTDAHPRAIYVSP